MSGASILDFGDAVRAGAATFTEDEKFGNIELDLDLYRGYVQGYCHEMGRILNRKGKRTDGIRRMADDDGKRNPFSDGLSER